MQHNDYTVGKGDRGAGITDQFPIGVSILSLRFPPTATLTHRNRTKRRKGPDHPMTARIFKPAKNAMQSGRSKTREWQLDYEPEQPRAVEPLMGWTSSGDMKQQITLRFDSKEEAVAYCERKGIAYQVIEPQDSIRRPVAYADNFSFRRGEPWTH
ncbi:blr4414 [Bradyrhizobium diazoefficiens USDA 110]|uniref:Blr4414 protein n=3 Tax=Bradyrhizobium diazoefficiens TaxID=1355477 RepID=Q89LX9_BRADU|nr:blr4414 [Bradyrhizobium diazoefficiens USDA 110]